LLLRSLELLAFQVLPSAVQESDNFVSEGHPCKIHNEVYLLTVNEAEPYGEIERLDPPCPWDTYGAILHSMKTMEALWNGLMGRRAWRRGNAERQQLGLAPDASAGVCFSGLMIFLKGFYVLVSLPKSYMEGSQEYPDIMCIRSNVTIQLPLQHSL
jgi:hypothetical protein